MEPTRRRLPIGPIVGSIIILGLITLIVVKLMGADTANQSDTTSSSDTATAHSSTPASPATSAAAVDFDHPTAALVWSFEEAYLVLDPGRRSDALAKVATPAYIQANPIVNPKPKVSDVQSLVVRDKSPAPDWQPTADPTVCYVITYAVIQTKRGDTVLNTYATDQPHVTKWIKTPQGWLADQEASIEMR